MTFSICVREPYEGRDGAEHTRFGVAVTTRLPAVGTMCPFVSEDGAVATQSLVNIELGRKGLAYIEDGLAVEDALDALLNADDGAPSRQLHGVDDSGSFVFSGDECRPWFGHRDEGTFTVAGNLLTGEAVIDATASAYQDSRHAEPAGPGTETDADTLVSRLIDALAAGHAEGGDKREDLPIQSAAVLVATTEDLEPDPVYHQLRIDATETPIADLRTTYENAVQGYRDMLDRYEEAYEEDELASVDE